jgi:hypothetical protein
MRIKYLFVIFLASLFSQHGICHAKITKTEKTTTKTGKAETKDPTKLQFSVWPIFFGGGTFFFTELGPEESYPGYLLSGGLTVILSETITKTKITLFADALLSYRAYDGFPEMLNYSIKETTADIAIAAGLDGLYAGAYVQFPMSAKVKVREWTLDDFNGLSRNPSFSLMGGLRMTGKHLGVDARILLGQGPGQFLKKPFGERQLGQISLGIMAGF